MRELWTVPDRLCGLPGRFTVARCVRCGLVRQEPRVADESLGDYYPEDYTVFVKRTPPALGRGRTHAWRRDWLRWRVEGRPGLGEMGLPRWLRLWPARLFAITPPARLNPLAFSSPGKRLLDVGCGTGDFCREMRALGWDTAGIEPDARAAEMAREDGIPVVTGRFPEQAHELSGPFDAITMSQVIEHLPDPIAALGAARELLADGGVLVVWTPWIDGLAARATGAYWYPLEQPRHLTLFSRPHLRASMERAGLRVVAEVGLSSTASWTRSVDYRLDEGRATPRHRLDHSRWLHRLLRPLVRLLDLIGLSDGGAMVAVKGGSSHRTGKTDQDSSP
ncbi:MAG: class I SAM-dependent methyltransferase [Deltaproteobacteria bacterium]|nr:class I SAM-dependent methyltransferase [Deltaproteobacteria bacterium]